MLVRFSGRCARGLQAVVLGAVAALLQACDSPPDTLKIGVAQPLTGNLASLGQDLLNGVTLAVEELNKKGFTVNGKPVLLEVVAMDDRANASTGVEVAHQLVDAGVVAVIGHLNSGVSIAAAPVYAAKNIAQLAISTNPKFTQLGFNTTFRLVANDTLQAKAIGSYSASQFKATKYAVLDDGTPYGKDLAAGAAVQLKAAQKEVVVTQSFDDKTTAFDALAEKIKASGVEAIVSTLNDFQVLALFDALRRVNYAKVALLGGDTLKTTLTRKAAGAGQQLYVTSPILEVSEFPAGGAFLEKYRARFKLDPAYAGHYTYDATYVLAAAIGRTPSAKPAAIVEALRKLDGYAPVTGSMKWDAKGEQRYGVIGVYHAREGVWESQVRSDVW